MTAWTIVVEPLAQLDLDETYQWYESAKTGLGEEFFDALEDTIEKIRRNPQHASAYDNQTRSASLSRFPYEIIYLVEETTYTIYIIAISHQHRKPGWFKNR